MKYKTKHGELDFWDPYPSLNKFKKIGINLSGGAWKLCGNVYDLS